MPKLPLIAILVCTSIGILFGVGTYAFLYAKGFSYLSKDPAACANCHVMQPKYDGWLKSSHHTVATCVDCHLPHDLLGKYYVKAENGFMHSMWFTLGTYPDNIQIRDSSRRVLNRTCIDCHSGMAGHIADNDRPGEKGFCTKCHADVGH